MMEEKSSSAATKPPFRMEYDSYRDDQLNTGVISALIGGFSLTNSWELARNGTMLDTVTYVLAIVAVHACTCSAITSAFLYRTLTCSDPEKAVLWMEKHSTLASFPHGKFVIGTLCYLASVVLVAWKELAEENEARIFTLAIGVTSCSAAIGTFFLLTIDPPSKMAL